MQSELLLVQNSSSREYEKDLLRGVSPLAGHDNHLHIEMTNWLGEGRFRVE